MAIPTPVNGQITDAITQTNISVVGSSPGQAMSVIYQSTAQAISLSMQNSVSNQQQTNELGMAILTRCVHALTGDNSHQK
ncbi:RebB family R body protein [Gallaecimonas sp. GXIMD1310]|uniref:RebB family R body protein n=1 Tax=Gallaecimonas sp. GXIMD1310 TaxID=3131926 RepID=UPI003247B190